jgi:hypothetical protein
VARRLLLHLLAVLSPSGEVVIGIDDTIRRCSGGKIKARGIYRDAVQIVTWPIHQDRRVALAVAGGDIAGPIRGPSWAPRSPISEKHAGLLSRVMATHGESPPLPVRTHITTVELPE